MPHSLLKKFFRRRPPVGPAVATNWAQSTLFGQHWPVVVGTVLAWLATPALATELLDLQVLDTLTPQTTHAQPIPPVETASSAFDLSVLAALSNSTRSTEVGATASDSPPDQLNLAVLQVLTGNPVVLSQTTTVRPAAPLEAADRPSRLDPKTNRPPTNGSLSDQPGNRWPSWHRPGTRYWHQDGTWRLTPQPGLLYAPNWLPSAAGSCSNGRCLP